MAVYGRSLYGTSTYGPDLRLPPPPPPLDVVIRDRRSVALSWTPVASDVTAVAVLRSLWGVPTNIAAGTIIGQWNYDAGSHVDTDVSPGVRYYYGLFLLTPSGWQLASGGTVLFPRDHGYKQRFAMMVPPLYYRSTSTDAIDILDPPVDPNDQALTRFLDVIALAMDAVHTAVDAATDVTDAYSIDDRWVATLGQSVGVDVTATAVRGPQRDLIANAGAWAATRGTPRGLESVARAVTGWRARVMRVNNLLVDQATTDGAVPNNLAYRAPGSPTPPLWTATTAAVFPPGYIVSVTGANAGTYVNIGPTQIVQGSAAVTDPTAPGVDPRWVPYVDPLVGRQGNFTTFTLGVDTTGAVAAPGAVAGTPSVLYGALTGAPAGLSGGWTWNPGTYTASVAATATTLATGTFSTALPASANPSDAYPAPAYASPVPECDASQVLVASHYTQTPDFFPAVFGYDFDGNLTTVANRSQLPLQWLATTSTDGPLSGSMDVQGGGDSWVLSGNWFGRAATDQGGSTLYPSTASGRTYALAVRSLRVGTLAVTLANGQPWAMGLVFGYADDANYFYATGAQFVTRIAGVETAYQYTSYATAGQRLAVSVYDATGTAGPAQVGISVRVNGAVVYTTVLAGTLPGAQAGLISFGAGLPAPALPPVLPPVAAPVPRVASVVQNVNIAIGANPQDVLVWFDAPTDLGTGTNLVYHIDRDGVGTDNQVGWDGTVPGGVPTQTNPYVFHNMAHGTNYTITIWAQTSAGKGAVYSTVFPV